MSNLAFVDYGWKLPPYNSASLLTIPLGRFLSRDEGGRLNQRAGVVVFPCKSCPPSPKGIPRPPTATAIPSAGRIHHVMRCFFRPKNVEKNIKHCCKHDVLEPSKQALWASRDVTISSQNFGSKWQRVFLH